ncbi:MAG TPA: hypothetical protein VF425_09640, partial [Thermoanaerobaculia bacterium]
TTRIPEGALEAAIAEARVPAPVKGAKKRASRAKPAGTNAEVAEVAGAAPARAVRPKASRKKKS